MSAVTGARRKTSSPSASERALRIAQQPAPTGGSPMPRAPDRRFRIGNIDRGPLPCWPARPESWAACCGGTAWPDGQAVVLVVDPLLADGMADAQTSSGPESGRPERAGWMHGADVGDGEEIQDADTARFRRRLRLRRSRDEGERLAVVRRSCRAPRPSAPALPELLRMHGRNLLMSFGSSWPS